VRHVTGNGADPPKAHCGANKWPAHRGPTHGCRANKVMFHGRTPLRTFAQAIHTRAQDKEYQQASVVFLKYNVDHGHDFEIAVQVKPAFFGHPGVYT